MADNTDLFLAHQQKSILRIQVDGSKFGKGAYRGPLKWYQIMLRGCLVLLVIVVGALLLARHYRKTLFVKDLKVRIRKIAPCLFWEANGVVGEDDVDPKKAPLSNHTRPLASID